MIISKQLHFLWGTIIFCLALTGCSSYNQKLTNYYKSVNEGSYKKALQILDNNSFIKSNRNLLLYYLERGKLLYQMQLYDSSNKDFNTADFLIENTKKSAGDVAKAYLLNPMLQTYLGEDFERFMMHYFKALNYLNLNQPEEALVEAKRINLAQNALFQKYNEKTTRYSKDAFAMNLQGVLYEINKDLNNAFIAYRNAADLYLSNQNIYYGVQLPNQLKQDVLRTAHLMGFEDERERYEKLFNTSLNNQISEGGELIIFIESGVSPVKREKNFIVTKDANGIDGFFYLDENGRQIAIPFDFDYYRDINRSDENLKDLKVFRMAMPYYQAISMYEDFNVSINNTTITAEKVQDINSLAVNTLNERLLKELADALARQIIKRLTELGVKKATEGVAKKNNTKEQSKEAGEVAEFLMNVINTVTEKADTRNWQGLPAYVSYVRVPLQKGSNTILIKGKYKSSTIQVTGNGTLLAKSITL